MNESKITDISSQKSRHWNSIIHPKVEEEDSSVADSQRIEIVHEIEGGFGSFIKRIASRRDVAICDLPSAC